MEGCKEERQGITIKRRVGQKNEERKERCKRKEECKQRKERF